MNPKKLGAVRPRVLVVDDDGTMRATCCALLENDFEVESAQSGAEAMALLQGTRFDGLCTDHKMPGMPGLELVVEATKLANPPSPVVGTAYSESALRDRTAETPPFLLLVKPYNPLALIELVRRAQELGSIRRELVPSVESEPPSTD